MNRNLDGYCRELQSKVAALTDEAAGDACLAHTNAFNFGRSIGRRESAGDDAWQRVRWLLIGGGIGLAVAAVCLQAFLEVHILQFVR